MVLDRFAWVPVFFAPGIEKKRYESGLVAEKGGEGYVYKCRNVHFWTILFFYFNHGNRVNQENCGQSGSIMVIPGYS